jgi:GNAT superfamily N-acetyltransferase
MRLLRLSLLVIISCIHICNSGSQHTLGGQAVIRNATLADEDAITNIIIDAYASAPEIAYCYQFRDKYPKYHWECMRRSVREALEQQSDDIIVNVIDAPISDSKDTKDRKAVALAIWELNTGHRSGHFSMSMSTNCSAHLDMNITRALHFDRQLSAAKKVYIDEAYDRQVYLNLLATHPDYEGRGFGAAHCGWGKALARRKGQNVTLIATPAGYRLYKTIGFERVANISFTKVGGAPLTWFEAMVYQV